MDTNYSRFVHLHVAMFQGDPRPPPPPVVQQHWSWRFRFLFLLVSTQHGGGPTVPWIVLRPCGHSTVPAARPRGSTTKPRGDNTGGSCSWSCSRRRDVYVGGGGSLFCNVRQDPDLEQIEETYFTNIMTGGHWSQGSVVFFCK